MLASNLHTVVLLVIDLIILTTNGIRNSCKSHQITLIGTVDKDFCLNYNIALLSGSSRVLESDICDAVAILICGNNAAIAPNLDILLGNVILEDFLGDMWLEYPLFQRTIVSTKSTIKIKGKTFHNILVTDVGHSQTTRRHSADVGSRLDEQNALSLLLCSVSSDNTERSSAIYTDIHALCHLLFRSSI